MFWAGTTPGLQRSASSGTYQELVLLFPRADVKPRAQLSFACPVQGELYWMPCSRFLSFPWRLASSPGYPTSVIDPNMETQNLGHL